MKNIRKIVNYIKDSNFKINYVNNSVNVIHYDTILEVRDSVITLKKEDKIIHIKGEDLRLNKLLENEVLVTGLIKSIELYVTYV